MIFDEYWKDEVPNTGLFVAFIFCRFLMFFCRIRILQDRRSHAFAPGVQSKKVDKKKITWDKRQCHAKWSNCKRSGCSTLTASHVHLSGKPVHKQGASKREHVRLENSSKFKYDCLPNQKLVFYPFRKHPTRVLATIESLTDQLLHERLPRTTIDTRRIRLRPPQNGAPSHLNLATKTRLLLSFGKEDITIAEL